MTEPLFSIDDETTQIAIGPLVLEVKWLRDDKVPLEVIAGLWRELSSTYRRWEMRDMPGPKWGAYHHVHHWLINGGDRDQGPAGFFSDDVSLAQRFDSTAEVKEWIEARGLMHPEAPGSHERAGFTILRLR